MSSQRMDDPNHIGQLVAELRNKVGFFSGIWFWFAP
jgi:hypothetical protein